MTPVSRQLPATDYAALKAATRQLVSAAGGGNEAAKATRVGQQVLSGYGSLAPEHRDRFAPLDVVADLEAECGQPIVTRKLAALNNCLLVQLPTGPGHGAVTERSGRSAHEFGEVMAGVFGALANDGRITPDEAGPILNDIRELMLELAGLAEAVKAATEVSEGADG
jgi:hypothetical protein